MDKTSLYRHFDITGNLLYVGISVNAFKRFSEHKDQKDWSGDICSMTIEYFDTRVAALAAEKNAIKAEKPLHNVTYNKPPKPVNVVSRKDIVVKHKPKKYSFYRKGVYTFKHGKMVSEDSGKTAVLKEHIILFNEWLEREGLDALDGYVVDGDWILCDVDIVMRHKGWEYLKKAILPDSVPAPFDTNNGWDVWAKKHEDEGKRIREQLSL